MDENWLMRSEDSKARRKKPGLCPVCLKRLAKNARGTRYERRCKNCRASFQKALKCLDCGTHRVWQGPEGTACKGCGRTVVEGDGRVMRLDLVSAHDVWRRLRTDFPELIEATEFDQNSVHLTLGELERFANEAISLGDFPALQRAYDFIVALAADSDSLHPDVLNAIQVSFLEGLSFAHSRNGEKAKSVLPPILKGMWDRQMAHNRRIGWK